MYVLLSIQCYCSVGVIFLVLVRCFCRCVDMAVLFMSADVMLSTRCCLLHVGVLAGVMVLLLMR